MQTMAESASQLLVETTGAHIDNLGYISYFSDEERV